MKLKDLPMIYNLDKMRIWDGNKLLAELNVGSHAPTFYLQEDERTRDLLIRKIDEMSIVCEGVLGLVVVLEIYLK
jgi:hypothetical protein